MRVSVGIKNDLEEEIGRVTYIHTYGDGIVDPNQSVDFPTRTGQVTLEKVGEVAVSDRHHVQYHEVPETDPIVVQAKQVVGVTLNETEDVVFEYETQPSDYESPGFLK